ncbi:DUF4330 domain-containing protein [Petroclostridium sp. X23]|uniref:DUF4330 domain-containing protein n=1 Tax=Petroclostridium sp. X23 TaxID=3045146 RepID=UPI0024AC8331|nr:DUF4330 domain-containing protein [Petroclostridium sp. X23]WHH58378.1 DUF4330 domain-containing protein [Petroclostridium sp. X23]
MLIDDKGRLFGKFNIIDLLIVLVILGAAAGAFYKFGKANVGPIVKQDEIIIKFFADEAPEYAAKAVKVGDVATDDQKNTYFGQVIEEPVIDGSLSYGVNSEGKYVQSSKPGLASAIITVQGKGTKGQNGAVFGGVNYGVGETVVLNVGKSTIWVRVYDVEVKE